MIQFGEYVSDRLKPPARYQLIIFCILRSPKLFCSFAAPRTSTMSLCTGVCEGRISVELVELELPRGLLTGDIDGCNIDSGDRFLTSRIQVDIFRDGSWYHHLLSWLKLTNDFLLNLERQRPAGDIKRKRPLITESNRGIFTPCLLHNLCVYIGNNLHLQWLYEVTTFQKSYDIFVGVGFIFSPLGSFREKFSVQV